jgi:hypothetical protein
MGPRSELVIHDPTAKRLQVVTGQVLAHVVAGTGAQVQGATATAAVKGTWILYQGPTEPGEEPARTFDQLAVWHGESDFTTPQGTESVGDQQSSGAPAGGAPTPPNPTYPFEYANGEMYPWWLGLIVGGQVDVTPGADPGMMFKNDLPTGRELLVAPPAPVGGDLDLTIRSPGAAPVTAATTGGLSAANALAAGGLSQLSMQRLLGRRFFAARSQVDTFGILYEAGSLAGFRTRANAIYDTFYAEAGLRGATDLKGNFHSDASELFVMDRLGNTDVIAGRQRYLEGPVNNDAIGALFGSVYFDGVSVRHRGKGVSALVAWVDDYDAPGAVGGWLARAATPVLGGQIGATAFAQRHNDVGWSVDVTLPAIQDELDVYGEFGTDPAGNQLGTVGLYFPGLYQRSDVDLFVEYGDREGAPAALSATAYFEGRKGWTTLAGLGRESGEWTVSLGAVKRFGALKP